MNSALIVAYAERYPDMWIEVDENERGIWFTAYDDSHINRRTDIVNYDNYTIVGNELTFRNGADLQRYKREQKLKRVLK